MKAFLSDGFEIELNEDRVGDWDFLEQLYDVDNGETGEIVGVARTLLGREGVKQLKAHLKERDGRVGIEAMVAALTELMESTHETKNS